MFNPWISHCVEKLFLEATPHSFKRREPRLPSLPRKSVFPERSLTEFRIAHAVPYGTPNSLTELLQSGFAAKSQVEKRLWNSY